MTATDPRATESAVLAVVPEAEPLVGHHRQVLDPTAQAGVPAHVTVLYPFVAPASITDRTVEVLRAAVAPAAPFGCRFDDLGWFGDDFLWLAPTPTAPFVDLTERVWRAFPDHPPYAGAHDGDTPHLTVGYRRHASLDALRDAGAAIGPALPLRAHVDRLYLLAGSREPDSWRVLAELPLAGPQRV